MAYKDDKRYCSNCIHFGLLSSLARDKLSYLCINSNIATVVDKPYGVVYTNYDQYIEANKNNDCVYYEETSATEEYLYIP